MSKLGSLLLIICLSAILLSCKKEKSTDGQMGCIEFVFSHKVDGANLKPDTLIYVNEAGNKYKVTDYQYFISNVVLHKHDGTSFQFSSAESIHYLDSSIPTTMDWTPSYGVPPGDYDSVSFTFGINEANNFSGHFVNPPESNMAWPDVMGGGYHYLKMNGFWKTPDNSLNPFNLHLGIGMDTNNLGQPVFVQNYFKVNLPSSGFSLKSGGKLKLEVVMNIESWFKTPHLWDWNVIGGGIMQNQAAMRMAVENGADVFTVGTKQEL